MFFRFFLVPLRHCLGNLGNNTWILTLCIIFNSLLYNGSHFPYCKLLIKHLILESIFLNLVFKCFQTIIFTIFVQFLLPLFFLSEDRVRSSVHLLSLIIIPPPHQFVQSKVKACQFTSLEFGFSEISHSEGDS